MKIKKVYLEETNLFLYRLGNSLLRKKLLKKEINKIESKISTIYNESNEYDKRFIKSYLNEKYNELNFLELYIDSKLVYIDSLNEDLKECVEERYFNVDKCNKLNTYVFLSIKMNLSESTVKRYISQAIYDLTLVMYGDECIEC